MAKAATPAADKAANSTQPPQTEGAAPNTQAGDNPAGDSQAAGTGPTGPQGNIGITGPMGPMDPKAARTATIKRNATRFANEIGATTGEAVSADAIEKHFRRLADEFGIDAAEVYAANRDGTAIVTVAGQKLPVAE